MSETEYPGDPEIEPFTAAEQEAQQDEDFYMDGPYCVFTEAFHLKRGFCCNSDCRHCPYKGENQPHD
jgi:hypothetical protein